MDIRSAITIVETEAKRRALVSTAPHHIVRRYLSGGCWTLAPLLAKMLKLPMFGLQDERGDIHHVFVVDKATATAFDIRGSMPLSEIGRGSVAPDGIIVPVTQDDILKVIGSFDPGEVREAKKVIRDFLVVRNKS